MVTASLAVGRVSDSVAGRIFLRNLSEKSAASVPRKKRGLAAVESKEA
ncbi:MULTISPECIES: hypothetical protein [unclassified Mesorhizobium]|nr:MULTISPECIES: hypothetical protein [unclassified Mesorhizobium]